MNAIKYAIDVAIEEKLSEVIIISDSLGNLRNISLPYLHLINNKYRHDIISEIIIKLTSAPCKVSFAWIPSHINIPLLDEIDIMAKKAVSSGISLIPNWAKPRFRPRLTE